MTLTDRINVVIEAVRVQLRKHTQKIAVAIPGLNAWWVMFAPSMPPNVLALGNLVMALAQWIMGGVPQTNVASYDPRVEAVYDPMRFRLVPIDGGTDA